MGPSRTFLWGVVFAPSSRLMVHLLVLHTLTLALEGQAYVVPMFAAYVNGSFRLGQMIRYIAHGVGWT